MKYPTEFEGETQSRSEGKVVLQALPKQGFTSSAAADITSTSHQGPQCIISLFLALRA